MHRTRRTYLRPPEHPGPESVMLGGTVRVKRGGTATLHTTDEQHAQLVAEGWQGVLPVEHLEVGAVQGVEEEMAGEPGEGVQLGAATQADGSPLEPIVTRRRKNGEVTNA